MTPCALINLLLSLILGFTAGTVCTKTGQLSEIQASIDAMKKDVDALRSLTQLLLNHYMLPHEITSITTKVYTVCSLKICNS